MAFITEVKSGIPEKKKCNENLLGSNIKKDYTKLQAVVKSFSQKVDVLVDKQRAEYMHAYEHHMIDVQRELHNLREKATAIANDTTREEKIKKLDSDQKWFRNEAMRLDVDTNVYRKKMRDIKALIQSTERERDWLLEKLRTAKAQYKIYKYERSILVEKGLLDEGRSTVSNDSSYTLELRCNNGISRSLNKSIDWRGQIERDFDINRTNTKHCRSGAGILLSPLKKSVESGSIDRPQASTLEKNALGSLVAARAKQDGLRDFVAECSNNARGLWSLQSRRPAGKVLEDCIDVVNEGSEDDSMRKSLSAELCLMPEVYFIINKFLSSKTNQKFKMASPMPEADCAFFPETKANVSLEGNDDISGNLLGLDSDVVDYFNSSATCRRRKLPERLK